MIRTDEEQRLGELLLRKQYRAELAGSGSLCDERRPEEPRLIEDDELMALLRHTRQIQLANGCRQPRRPHVRQGQALASRRFPSMVSTGLNANLVPFHRHRL